MQLLHCMLACGPTNTLSSFERRIKELCMQYTWTVEVSPISMYGSACLSFFLERERCILFLVKDVFFFVSYESNLTPIRGSEITSKSPKPMLFNLPTYQWEYSFCQANPPKCKLNFMMLQTNSVIGFINFIKIMNQIYYTYNQFHYMLWIISWFGPQIHNFRNQIWWNV